MPTTSFADLKQKRDSQANHTSPSKPADHGQAVPSQSATNSLKYTGIDPDLLEIRKTSTAGRSIFAKRRIERGTVILRLQPHLAILDKQHLPLLCSYCMIDASDACHTLRRCSACKAVFYCSLACQRSDWHPDRHKVECRRLQEWAQMCRAAHRPASEHVPDTPVRAIGKLILLKPTREDGWWQEVLAMADSPRRLAQEEQEQMGALALAVSQYIGGPEALQAIFSEMQDTRDMTRLLLALVDKFGINSFSLTSPDLSNIGVAVCPTVALINHACDPNCAVVFPEGPGKEMHVVAFRSIEANGEVLSSYVDLILPLLQRQEDLVKQYKFECVCDTCLRERANVSPRRAVRCTKPRCSGLLPIPLSTPGKDEDLLACGVCSAQKSFRHTADLPKTLGYAWASEEAKFQLAIPSLEAFVALPEQRQKAFEILLIQLSDYHKLFPASHPLLALHRLAQDRALDTGVELFREKRYERARYFATQVMLGLEALLPEGHPVRAVQQAVLARLWSIGPDGEEVRDDRVLLMAYEQLKKAKNESELAFGKKGILLSKLREDIVSMERDLEMRRRLRMA